MLKCLIPNRYVDSIHEVGAGELERLGIKGVITDMDNTLIPWNERSVNPELVCWMQSFKEKGLKMCIVSNNSAVQGEALARQLEIPAVWYAVKPRRKAFRKAISIMGLLPGEVAVIGDQLFTDVLGGNRLGLYTILVVPLSQKEFIWTKMIRAVERRLLASMQKRGLLVRENEGGCK